MLRKTVIISAISLGVVLPVYNRAITMTFLQVKRAQLNLSESH